MNYHQDKVTIIGAGMVGSTTAFSLLAGQIAAEVALIDINPRLAKSQVMDLQHSVPFWGYARVKVGAYVDIKDSRVVVVAGGAAQKPGETRLDLIKKNSAIIKEVLPKIFRQNKDAVVIIVTNPVDVLTHLAIRMFPGKKKRIIGSGTVLDSARLRFLLGQRLKVNPKSIHAYIVGEHGDSEVPLWSTATIGNAPLDKFQKLSAAEKEKIFKAARNAAYAIIAGKQATYYAIAAGVAQLVKTILADQQTVLPVSHLLEGEYGLKDVCLSLPVVVGRDGVMKKFPLDLSPTEKKQLLVSAAVLKKSYRGLL